MKISIDRIHPNPDQPRKAFDQSALDELAASIREMGLIQPVAVRPDGDTFMLIAGERRWRASQQAGLTEIPAIVLEADDDEMFVRSIAENVNREDMTPIEEANAFARLLGSRDKDEVAALFGKSRTYIETRVFLLRLDPTIQHLVARAQISQAVGFQLARLSVNGQFDALRKFTDEMNDSAKIRVIAAMVEQESEITMFDLDESEAAQTQVRTRSNRHVVAAEKAAVALDALLDIPVGSLAALPDGELEILVTKMKALQGQARSVALHAEKARTAKVVAA